MVELVSVLVYHLVLALAWICQVSTVKALGSHLGQLLALVGVLVVLAVLVLDKAVTRLV